MTYNEFANRIKTDLEQQYSDVLGNPEIEMQHVEKLQGETYDGLSIKPEGQLTAVSIRLDEVFRQYEAGRSYQSILRDIADAAKEGIQNTPSVNLAELMDYDLMKQYLMAQVVPIKGNENMLAQVPHEVKEDLACVYRFVLDVKDNQSSSILVTNKMLDTYGISPAQLRADALRNSPERFPYSIRSMQQVLCEMMGMTPDTVPMNANPMYVATCNSGMNGAGCVFYPDFMKKAAEMLHGDFFVLPSSIHEVLLIPDNGEFDYHNLEEMVQSINESEVRPADRLSDSVYHYDSKQQIFEKSASFVERTSGLKARIEAAEISSHREVPAEPDRSEEVSL